MANGRPRAKETATVVFCGVGTPTVNGKEVSSRRIDLPDGWHFFGSAEPAKGSDKEKPQPISFQEAPLDGIRSYLATYAFKGIGSKTADSLLSNFQGDVFMHLSQPPKAIAEQCNIPRKAAEAFCDAWAATANTRNLQILLRQLGFGNAACREAIDKYGADVIERLLEDPYALVGELRYFSFDDASNAITAIGLEQQSDQRLSAAIKEVLRRTERQRGHTCMPLSRLSQMVQSLSADSAEDVEHLLHSENRNFRLLEYRNTEVVASKEGWEREQRIITFLKKLGSAGHSKSKKLKFNDRSTDGHTLSKQQRQGIEMALGNRLALITGGPGTGKSTLVATLVRELRNFGREVTLCAPTGRAARRLELADDLKGVQPATIHRMLTQISADQKAKVDALIIDEASMVDLDLMVRVIDVLDEDTSTLIMIGDADQLPPVGPGQLFSDLLNNEGIQSLRLTENFRQSDGSGIIDAAGSVIGGRMPKLSGVIQDHGFTFIEREDDQDILSTVLDLYMRELPSTLAVDTENDIQILSPQRSELVGTENLNAKIQKALRAGNKPIRSDKKRPPLFVGDKVINTSNNYELGVMNGDIGRVLRGDEKVDVSFDDQVKKFDSKNIGALELAYAITIHKSQGSEYPVVLVPISNAHSHMLGRNLIYTAITRAKRAAIVVGSKQALEASVDAAWKDFRYTLSPTLLSSTH